MPRETLPPESPNPQPGLAAANLPELLRLAAHGDWRTRALSISQAGLIARRENVLQGLAGLAIRRIPGWRRHFPAAGVRGRYLRNHITDGLYDRSWPVRVAAALALGECRAASKIPKLRRLLGAPLRAERIAAATAILACGGRLPGAMPPDIAGASAAPERVGDTVKSVDLLSALAAAHPNVLATWRSLSSQEQPAGKAALDWGLFMAGDVHAESYTGTSAEIERYEAEAETEYLLTKPFSHINRSQNVRLLHSFLVASEQLRVPPGGRILDLGGGSAWVSELLATMGFQAFTLDLSSALLNVGTRRFAREGLTPRFMVGDMTSLPVATASMEAVMVLDALHHVPDVPAVFREAFRVLATGGQFILAEPGEGHAEAEKSRAEMMEHGVLEREIHVFEAIDYARAAGFDHIRIVPHYVPGISMTPAQLTAAMGAPADEWMIHQEDRLGFLSPYLLQSIFERPILVFRKGVRAVDSRMPRLLRAEISAALVRDGARVTGVVSVRNAGDTVWLGGGAEVGQVRIGVQLLNADRRLLNMEFSRTPLRGNLPPGETAQIPVDLTLPDAHTPYVLKIDLVDEGICWFEDGGSKPFYLAIKPA